MTYKDSVTVDHAKHVPIGDEVYEIRITRLIVLPDGESLFSERATAIELQDEAAGEFVSVRQQLPNFDARPHEIRIDPDEWATLKSAIDYMIGQCR